MDFSIKKQPFYHWATTARGYNEDFIIFRLLIVRSARFVVPC